MSPALTRRPDLLGLILAGCVIQLFMGPSPAHAQADSGERGILGRLEGVGIDLLSDTWSVLKAPGRIDRSHSELLVGVFGVGAALFAFDEQIDGMIQTGRDRKVPSAIEDLGEFLEPLGNVGAPTVAMAAGWAVAGAIGQSKASLILQELVTAELIGTATRHVGRYVVGRSRPRDGEGAYSFQFGGGTSFPSGHASTIAQIAYILSHHIDNSWATAGLWTGAGAVMYQRLTSGAHWSSDVWFGAFWGWGIAKVVVEAREADWIDLGPSLDSATGQWGIRGKIRF